MALLTLEGSLTADRNVLGGKAFGIVQLLRLGIPVPPAVVITTDECARYYQADRTIPADIIDALPGAIATLERATGRTFGGGELPLLVSVRSGAPTSMPGMMDTILNLGNTPAVEQAIAAATGDARFAADTRARFEHDYEKVVGRPAPADPMEQLAGAIAAVFDSWHSARALAYRRDRGLSDDSGTAVTVQAMVFGNLDERSGTGVLFSRDPLTGAREPFGEWLPMGQGEDVVSGTADPLPLQALNESMPAVHAELMEATSKLERHGRDVQDIEFTVEAGRLWLLQTRSAKRSGPAAVRFAIELQQEGMLSEAEALDRVTPEHVASLLQPHIDPAARRQARVLASGRPASPGLVSGTVVTDVDDAETRALDGEDIILARPTTNPDDVHAMSVVAGVLTEVGGATSHAAVVGRELGVACVVGCGSGVLMPLDGRQVTVDAGAGEIFDGALPLLTHDVDEHPDLALLARWAREERGAAADVPLPELLRARAQGRDAAAA
jgi:pyruvate,orthophosphate dikinase